MSKLCIISLFAVWSVLLLAQSVRSATPPASPPKDNNPYILKGFNNKQVVKLLNGNKKCDKCWKTSDYKVCVQRWGKQGQGPEFFTWINKKLPFILDTMKFKGGYTQTWKFEDGGIELSRGSKGNISQRWELPNAEWRYTKSAEGEVNEEWVGEKNEDEVQYYKSVIDSWCAVNYVYEGKENCAIY